MNKYRIADIIYAFTMCMIGIIGFLLIPEAEAENVWLILFVVLQIFTLPIYFYSLIKRIFYISSILPFGFSLAYALQFQAFEKESTTFWTWTWGAIVISILLSLLATILIHSKKKIEKRIDEIKPAQLKKRALLLIKDLIIIFTICFGIVIYTNVAFDSSESVEFEVTIVDVASISRHGDKTFDVQYEGYDSKIIITSIPISKQKAASLSKGDKLLLKYRTGYLDMAYYWIT